jgi:hypothetical protein
MAGHFVGQARVNFAHAGHGRIQAGITFWVALFEAAKVFDPFADASGRWAVDVVLLREAEAFDGDGFVYAVWIDTRVVQDDATAEGMARQANGEIVDDVKQGGEIENVFGHRVSGAWSPAAIAMAAEVEGENVIVAAQRLRDPIPIAGVVEGAVDQD